MIADIDGYAINYIDEGDTRSPAVLLLHGWGANINSFANLKDLLKTKYRVIALDYPGFGESSHLDRSFSVDDYADIIVKFLDKIKVKKVLLIGHSYGGRIIIKLNSRLNLPFEIDKNIVIDAAGIKDKKNFVVRIKVLAFKIIKLIVNLLPCTVETKNRVITKYRKKFGSKDYLAADRVMQETLIKSVNEDLTRLLPMMRETLIIWGDRDTVTPLWMAKRMNKLIKNSGLVLLHGGHFSYLDDPITFSKVMMSYLKINE